MGWRFRSRIPPWFREETAPTCDNRNVSWSAWLAENFARSAIFSQRVYLKD